MTALLELAPFFLLALTILLWPGASTKLVEAIVEVAAPFRRAACKLATRRPPRSEPDRGRILAALGGARAPPAGLRPASA